MIFSRLETRLLFAVGLLAVAAVCAVAFSARHLTRVEFRKLQQHERSPVAAQRAANAASILAGRCCASDVMRRAVAELAPDQAIIVVDVQGRLVTSAGPGIRTASLQRIETRTESGVLRVSGAYEDSGRARMMSLQIRGPPTVPRVTLMDGRSASVYVISIPRMDGLEPAAAFLGSVDRRLLLASCLVGALALGLVWVIARRIAGPISQLNEAAAGIARGNLAHRVDVSGSDEVAALSRTFNTMAAELERQQMLQRHLVQDVAHELRTPLTALQCRLETLLDGLATDPRQALEGATEEVRHLSRLLDDLQEIAIAESRQLKLRIAETPVAEVVLSAARVAGLEHDSRLRVNVDNSLSVHADAVRIRQVIINLLTNAKRHTPSDGEIMVRASRTADVVAVEVRNTGSALDAEQLRRVFDRFYRGDPARQRTTGGTGLGLTIVKHLIAAHGGEVHAASDATGVTIGFTLPATPNR
jgi:signal transduction histidine kinase